MKKIFYRLQFRIEEIGDKTQIRNDRLNSLLSSLENIDTEKQIAPPIAGSIIEVDGIDYEVTSKKYSFMVENEMVFYTTIITLTNRQSKIDKEKKEKDKISSQTDVIKKYLQDYDIDKNKYKQFPYYGNKYGDLGSGDWFSQDR